MDQQCRSTAALAPSSSLCSTGRTGRISLLFRVPLLRRSVFMLPKTLKYPIRWYAPFFVFLLAFFAFYGTVRSYTGYCMIRVRFFRLCSCLILNSAFVLYFAYA